MNALLVLDPQIGILKKKDFSEELTIIRTIISDFKDRDQLVVLFQHSDSADKFPNSPLVEGSKGSKIFPEFIKLADYIVPKRTPSGFMNTELQNILQKSNVNHVFVVGFNTEYCCLFTSLGAFEKGYDVTFIEDATGTVNDEKTYEMPGLDIRDMVGSILNWSRVIEVLYYADYVEKYGHKRNR
ncbi:cysteine hydrolase family protein [Sporolactobacillus terrae]|uniref:cysteine hydrolase family protein n=1 Tax=Sporolactobacillus terrae TaxID=269673 RepID=UPI00048C371D|nr:isochorismatase family cysteine hydrolase [Sporolactobacillus terrae]